MLPISYSIKRTAFFSLLFLTLPAYSACGHPYVGGSLGTSFGNLDHQHPKISYLSGDTITDAYPLQKKQAWSSIVSLNAGYEFIGQQCMPAVALGLGIYTNLAGYSFKGKVIETAGDDPSSTLFHYRHHINSTRLMAEMRLTWTLWKFSPYIDLGLGSVWNKMHGYDETALESNGYMALPPFHKRSHVNFAYQAGLGVSTAFNFANYQCSCDLKERVSLGYHYVNLGSTSFGARGSAYPHRLHTGTFTMNDIYLSYTHLF